MWIHESADLSGMRKAEVEQVKARASRRTDKDARGLCVYAEEAAPTLESCRHDQQRRIPEVADRQPAVLAAARMLKMIDLDQLRRDRLQLWGEAAHLRVGR